MLSVQFRQLLLLCLLLTALCACIIPGHPAVPPACATGNETPIAATYTPYRLIEVGIAATTSYPTSFFQRAMAKIVQAITDAVVPNTGGLDVTVSLIHANSFDDQSSVVATIHIPPIDADATAPVLVPTPTPMADPLHTADVVSTVEAKNRVAQTTYQCQLFSSHQKLEEVKQAVKKQTDMLLSLHPQRDTTTDIWGMIGRAAKRFAGVQGKKLLILATDYENTTWNNFTTDIYLPDVTVRSIYSYRSNQEEYEANTSWWMEAFKHAGAVDAQVYDDVQSDQLDLFS